MDLVELLKTSSHRVTVCKPGKIKNGDSDTHKPFIWTVPTTTTTKTAATVRTTQERVTAATHPENEHDGIGLTIKPTDMIISEPEQCTNNGNNFRKIILPNNDSLSLLNLQA